jgi:hypothetical protein
VLASSPEEAQDVLLFSLSFSVLPAKFRESAPIKNVAIVLDTKPCSPYVNRRFGRKSRVKNQQRERETSVQQVARQNSTLKMEVTPSSEMWVHIRTTRSYITDDGIIRNYAVKTLNPEYLIPNVLFISHRSIRH